LGRARPTARFRRPLPGIASDYPEAAVVFGAVFGQERSPHQL